MTKQYIETAVEKGGTVMNEYIDRELLLRDIEHYHVSDFAFQHWVEIQPAADVVPVVHGQWKTEFDSLGWLTHTCTVCGYTKRTDIHVSLDWNYCPKCGAIMDGGEDNA